jgi:hypothetical protein
VRAPKEEGLIDFSALSESGYDQENEYFAHDVRLDKLTLFGRMFMQFIEDPVDGEKLVV